MANLLRYPATGPFANDSSHTLFQFVEYRRINSVTQPTERSTLSIVLPLPRSVPDNNRISIESRDLGFFGNDFGAMGQSLSDTWSSVRDGNADWLDILKFAASTAPGVSDLAGGQIGRETGIVRNPHTTAIFSGVNLKTHSLQWRLSPASKADADAIQGIINGIKGRIYPSIRDAGGFALNYPDEVYVKFVNANFPDIRKSFITDFSATYGGANGLSMFRDGNPVETELNMTFLEVEIITRETITGSEDDSDNPNVLIGGNS